MVNAPKMPLKLSGPVIVGPVSSQGEHRIEFNPDPLWELARAVAREMGVDPDADVAEVDLVEEAIRKAVAGVADDLIWELQQYAETGRPNESSRYVEDCLRLVRQRKEARA